VTPVVIGVSVICFLLVHIAPGDPLSAVLPADATQELVEQMRAAYGFDRPLPVQYALWFWKVVHGDLGNSIATGRSVASEVGRAVGNTLILATVATVIGFTFGALFGFVAGYFNSLWPDKLASLVSVLGVSVPHYWLGMVLVIIFSANLNWLPPTGAGPDGSSAWRPDLVHLRYILLPAVTMSVIPMGVIARTVRALVADILAREFVQALRAKGLTEFGVFRHVVTNAAPTALAVMGLQLGYLLGGSILIETVFSWPGTGFLLNAAIFQRDLPLLQGTILVLALFFVALNLAVDVLQTALDPRIKRS
jgi:peptide/nickel transport system permease protein